MRNQEGAWMGRLQSFLAQEKEWQVEAKRRDERCRGCSCLTPPTPWPPWLEPATVAGAVATECGSPLASWYSPASPPPEWETSIVDENLGVPDYQALPRPDLVGLTAFTSQAGRAYQLAAQFRGLGVPVIIGGIHASMCREEAGAYVDAVVTGEAEGVWGAWLADVRRGHLKPTYEGGMADLSQAPPARHDLLPPRYAFGALQTTRGCSLSWRQRPDVSASSSASNRRRRRDWRRWARSSTSARTGISPPPCAAYRNTT